MVPTPGSNPLQLCMRIKKNSPLRSQKEGKNTFLPTIGSIIPRIPPITDSTTNWPLVGMSCGRPTNNLISKTSPNETTQLVTIELVMGNRPK